MLTPSQLDDTAPFDSDTKVSFDQFQNFKNKMDIEITSLWDTINILLERIDDIEPF